MIVFGALFLTVILWVLCVFVGKMVYSSFRMSILHHCIKFFLVAIPSIILFTVVFVCNGTINKVNKFDNAIVQAIIEDEIRPRQADGFAEYVVQKSSSLIKSFMPFGIRFIDIDQLIYELGITDGLSRSIQGINLENTERLRQVLHTFISGITNGIRSAIKIIRNIFLAFVILLQFLSFGIVLLLAYIDRRRDALRHSV
jgi:hypothetical protein